MKWFRLYSCVLHDPKAQRLSPALFKHWINLLCLANEGQPRGALPSVYDIAFALRVKPGEAELIMSQRRAAGLIDQTPEEREFPHNWTRRQRWREDGRPQLSEWRELRAAVFARDNYTCHYCSARGISMQCDHVMPVSRGGSNELSISWRCEMNQARWVLGS